jgi:hypothetical protein
MANIIHCEKRCDEEMSNAILTTGQMIDKLEVGEVAEGSFGDFMLYVTKVKSGCFYQCSDGTGDKFDKPFTVFAGVTEVKWGIIPKFVTFEEAVQAYKNGKTIICFFPSAVDGKECKQTFIKSVPESRGDLSLYMIINGKWTIEN